MITFFRSEKHFTPRCWGLLAAAVVLMAAAQPVAAAGGEEVTYRLKWLFNVSVVGGLYADTHGYFEEEGLSVTIKQGGPERDAIRELEMGHADFGTASADQVIRALEKGSPVVVVAQLFQVNPLQWIYRPDEARIDRPEDLRGRVIGITYGGNDETIMRTLLAKAVISEAEVEFSSVRYDYTPFFRRKVNIWPVYRNAEGVILQHRLDAAGEPTAFFNPADCGVRFVANSVVVSEQAAKNETDRVRRFVRALLKGWRMSLDPDNSRAALSTLRRYDRDTADAVLAEQLEVTRRLVVPEDGAPVGRIDAPAWRQTERIMLDQRQIDKPVNVEKALRPVQ
jgi:NitT/TauT family transport system substrate-binding protein